MPMYAIRRYRFRGPLAQGVHGAPKGVEQALGIAFEDHSVSSGHSRAGHMGLQVGDNFLRMARGVHV